MQGGGKDGTTFKIEEGPATDTMSPEELRGYESAKRRAPFIPRGQHVGEAHRRDNTLFGKGWRRYFSEAT